MKIELKRRYTGEVLFTSAEEVESRTPEAISTAVLEAIASGVNLGHADLRGVILVNADLTGADFLGTNLGGTNLSHANLRGANLRGVNLGNANLRGVNLTNANLRDAYLDAANLRYAGLGGANLTDANLSRANLCGADLRGTNLNGAAVGGDETDLSSLGIAVDPGLPSKVRQAIETGGTLAMGSWHTCDTTHCLAGWAVHLSGPAGVALEKVTSTSVAGAILLPSAAHLFYSDNETAMAWINEQ